MKMPWFAPDRPPPPAAQYLRARRGAVFARKSTAQTKAYGLEKPNVRFAIVRARSMIAKPSQMINFGMII
jgi:hypothetical protein